MRIHCCRCVNRLLTRDRRISKGNVVQNATRENMKILQHHTDPSPHILRADVLQIDVVDENHTVVKIVKTAQQPDQRTFP